MTLMNDLETVKTQRSAHVTSTDLQPVIRYRQFTSLAWRHSWRYCFRRHTWRHQWRRRWLVTSQWQSGVAASCEVDSGKSKMLRVTAARVLQVATGCCIPARSLRQFVNPRLSSVRMNSRISFHDSRANALNWTPRSSANTWVYAVYMRSLVRTTTTTL